MQITGKPIQDDSQTSSHGRPRATTNKTPRSSRGTTHTHLAQRRGRMPRHHTTTTLAGECQGAFRGGNACPRIKELGWGVGRTGMHAYKDDGTSGIGLVGVSVVGLVHERADSDVAKSKNWSCSTLSSRQPQMRRAVRTHRPLFLPIHCPRPAAQPGSAPPVSLAFVTAPTAARRAAWAVQAALGARPQAVGHHHRHPARCRWIR